MDVIASSPALDFGRAVGGLYEGYAQVLLLGCLGPHLVFLLAYPFVSGRPRLRGASLALELTYGLINPVVYLTVFEPSLFAHAFPAQVGAFSLSLLGAYWAFRLFGPALPVPPSARSRVGRGLLAVCAAWVALVAARDLVHTLTHPSADLNQPWRSLMPLIVSPLYAFPVLIALRQRRQLIDSQSQSPFFLLTRRARAWAVATAIGMIALVGCSLWRPAETVTREELALHRSEILDAAKATRIDPALIAAIIVVNQRESTSPLRSALEELVAGAWLTDPKSHELISGALNPSLGLAQIKPVTAQTALALNASARSKTSIYSKEYREVPPPSWAIAGIPVSLLPGPTSLGPDLPAKEAVVAGLLRPSTNIELCALVLATHAAKWEAQNPAWSPRSRPEILATLYSIGFERSHPNPDPRPNDFGVRVAARMKEPWLRETFSPDLP